MTLDTALCEWLCLPAGALRGTRRSTLEEVREAARIDDWPRPSARWTRQMLECAHEQSAGRWYRTLLGGGALLRIVLPRHSAEACHGDQRPLLPEGGLDLAIAAERLAAWDEVARDESPECWSRITSAGTCSRSPIVLATAPLAGHPDYAMLPPGPALYHLDGLHRLLGWTLAGRVSQDFRVVAFLADPWALELRTRTRRA